MMKTAVFSSVYGPVKSWRYGRSLGIDPIGVVSACSFNCAYCQLGEIELHTSDRKVFIPTGHILRDLQSFAPWDVDVITLSGSGEPTLALNLAAILTLVKRVAQRPTLVLTNGSLLDNAEVRASLAIADQVSVKIDGIFPDRVRRVNRPVAGVNLAAIWAGLQQFRAEFDGKLSIQTMILRQWEADERTAYISFVESCAPDEIQLNIPSRPKPLKHHLDARENRFSRDRSLAVQMQCAPADVLEEFAAEIYRALGIPVRLPSLGCKGA